jgi:hypothetical protein
MLVNIHFNNKFVKNNLKELYLYYKLRNFATDCGGCFASFKFTNNEKYKVLPKLEELGWVNLKELRVNRYRKVVTSLNCRNRYANMDISNLSSITQFKSFLLASCEYSIVLKKEYINKGKDVNNNAIYSNELAEYTGLSTATITRWRAYVKKYGHNSYLYKFTNSDIDKLMDNKAFYTDNSAILKKEVLITKTSLEIFNMKNYKKVNC